MNTLLCYGDSNTWGSATAARPDGRYGPEERWPGVARKRLGPDWMVVEEGLSGGMGGKPAAMICVGTLEFDSVDAIGAAMGTHMPEIMGDIPNYTDITPVLEIAEVKK